MSIIPKAVWFRGTKRLLLRPFFRARLQETFRLGNIGPNLCKKFDRLHFGISERVSTLVSTLLQFLEV